MRLTHVWALLQESWKGWSTDNATRLGAALAYYTVFSLAPVLLIAIAIAGFVFGQDVARREVIDQVSRSVGPRVGDAIAPSQGQPADSMARAA